VSLKLNTGFGKEKKKDIKINYKRKIVMSFVLILEIKVKMIFLNIFFWTTLEI
jgi:hypothetical protein